MQRCSQRPAGANLTGRHLSSGFFIATFFLLRWCGGVWGLPCGWCASSSPSPRHGAGRLRCHVRLSAAQPQGANAPLDGEGKLVSMLGKPTMKQVV